MPPVVTFVGLSDSGKTTLIEKLLPVLKRRGIRTGTVKHAHHGFEIDREGKDSWRHQAAGAEAVVLVGPDRIGFVRRRAGAGLDDALPLLSDVDLIVVEGFKTEAYPKIEVLRAAQNHPPLFLDDPNLLALVTDLPMDAPDTTVFGLEDVSALGDFLQRRFRLSAAGDGS
jgi:molybdopterin-guanine dinucleotide biosynthesis protein B